MPRLFGIRAAVVAVGMMLTIVGATRAGRAQIGTTGVIRGCLSPAGFIRGIDETTGSCRTGDQTLSWYTKDGADTAFLGASEATVAVRATRSTQQQSGTVQFDRELFDTADLHSTDLDNSRLTAPVDGVYQITVNITWGNAQSPVVFLRRNSAGLLATTHSVQQATTQHVSTLASLSAGDFVEVLAFGGASAVIVADSFNGTPEFSMIKVGALPN